MTESSTALIRKASLGVVVGAVAVLLLGVDMWQQSSEEEAEATDVAESTTTSASAATTTGAAEPAPARCGNPRAVTVEEATPVRWELVRESDSATTACPRVTLYKDNEAVSEFELSDGATFIDGDDGLWTYRDGAEAMPADQSVNPSEQSTIWLIARTSDGRTVSAKLPDGQLDFG